MRKLLSAILVAFTIGGSMSSDAMSANTAPKSLENESVAADGNLSEELERAYNLIKQFASEQKAAGNHAFYYVIIISQADLIKRDGDDLNPLFKDKVVVIFDYPYRKEFLDFMKDFMQANNIDENLIFYLEAQ